MFSYESIFKLVDSKLIKRPVNNDDAIKVNNKNLAKNDQLLNGKKSEHSHSNGKTSTSTKSSNKLVNFINVCAISILFVMMFYLIPWEKWVFSEHELEQLAMDTDYEYQNFLASADQTFDEIA